MTNNSTHDQVYILFSLKKIKKYINIVRSVKAPLPMSKMEVTVHLIWISLSFILSFSIYIVAWAYIYFEESVTSRRRGGGGRKGHETIGGEGRTRPVMQSSAWLVMVTQDADCWAGNNNACTYTHTLGHHTHGPKGGPRQCVSFLKLRSHFGAFLFLRTKMTKLLVYIFFKKNRKETVIFFRKEEDHKKGGHGWRKKKRK